MQSSGERIVIQIVLFNSADRLPRLLRALEHLDAYDARVRLLNNSPGDGSAAIASSYCGPLHVQYLDSPDGNLGFGRGHNLLAEGSKDAEFLLLLNPDTIPFHDSLRRLLDAAGQTPRAALLEAAQFPIEHQKQFDPLTGATNWCCAACLLVRAEVFRGLGGFDDRLFLYCEDVDLSWRVWAAGLECRYVPAARCVHVSQEEDIGKDRTIEIHHMHLGDLYLRRKWFGEVAVAKHIEHLNAWVGEAATVRLLSELDQISPPAPTPPRPDRAVLMPDHVNYAPTRW